MSRSALFILLGLLSAAGAMTAASIAGHTVSERPVQPIAELPRQGPWNRRISATGIVEGDGENIRLGIPEAGVIAEVLVSEGQVVAPGDPLLRIDDRLVRAELGIAEAEAARSRALMSDARMAQARASAAVQRLERLPRPEDALPVAARVLVAEAQLASARIQRARIEALYDKGSASADQVDLRRSAENAASALLKSARADLEHARLPAWDADLAIARADTALAASQVDSAASAVAVAEGRCAAIRVRLERHTVRSPAAATVVSLTATAGGMATAEDRKLVVLADLRRLLVRVDVDEAQAWKLQSGARGLGWVRGDPQHAIELAYLRTEPLAGQRQSMLGIPGERMDGRSLQVLYALASPPAYVRPGLMLEVDLQADAPEQTTPPAPLAKDRP